MYPKKIIRNCWSENFVISAKFVVSITGYSFRAVKLVRVLYAIAVYISYGLQCYPSVEILWNTYIYDRIKDSNHLLFWEYVLRVAAVLVTCKYLKCSITQKSQLVEVSMTVVLYIVLLYVPTGSSFRI